MSMNGYSLSHKFYEWAFENRQLLKPTVPALYFYLIEVCNTLGWKKQFSISAKECMEGMGVSSYNTYKSAFDILCDHGFITIIKKSCNHYQANIITLSNFNKVNDRVTNKVTDKVTTEYSKGNVESNCDIHKTNKTNETIKTVKQNKSVKNDDKINYAEFVSMTEEEYKKLISDYSELGVKRMIEILDNYKGANGKKYKSDYRAILNWVVERYNQEINNHEIKKEQNGKSTGEAGISTFKNFEVKNHEVKDFSVRF